MGCYSTIQRSNCQFHTGEYNLTVFGVNRLFKYMSTCAKPNFNTVDRDRYVFFINLYMIENKLDV